MKNDSNFYAILPASVRYDSDLSSSEKVFYAEITALSNKDGYCQATNGHFAELYAVAKSTISSWVNGLEKKGHVHLEYDKDGKQIIQRRIYPVKHFKALNGVM